MDRTIISKKIGGDFGPKLALLATAAMATIALPSSDATAAPRADVSYAKAEKALQKGKVSKAIRYAEEAVMAEPRNSAYRALLGTAYLEAGRYTSANQSFADALELGNTDSRTVLSYVLTATAIGDSKAALAELKQWESALDPADAGLAMALAGDPSRGVFVLTNALRAGQNTPKLRQNLAYTYALNGNWRAARVMAAEDVPANQLDGRLSQWASTASPEGHMARVSALLGISPVSDGGVPTSLALSNFPEQPQFAQQAPAPSVAVSMPAPVVASKTVVPASAKAMPEASTVKPPVERVAVAPKPVKAAKPFTPRYVSNPISQKLPTPSEKKAVAKAETKKAPKRAAPAPKGDTHLVQLGSYSSEAEAKRGWTTLKGKFPQLSSHDVVITKAQVKSKTYYRVAAAGFGRQGAANMCSAVKSAGRGCFAYSKAAPPKGAVGKGTRIAAATR